MYDTIPLTFIVNSNLFSKEFLNFVKIFNELENGYQSSKKLPIKHCKNNIWIIKQSIRNDSQRNELFNKLNDIKEFISSRPPKTLWLIQKYLEAPLFFENSKIDLRMLMLYSEKGDLYMYTKGLLLTSIHEKCLNKYIFLDE